MTLDVMHPETAHGVGGELAHEALQLVDQLAGRPIVTVADLEEAVRDRQAIGAQMKRVQAFFKPLKDSAYRLHKLLCDRESEILAPLQGFDSLKREQIAHFKREQDAARAEQERIEQERQRVQREAAAVSEAAALERVGDTTLAAAVIQEAISAPAPVVALPDVTKVEGLKFVRRWHWRYVQGVAFAMKLLPREYLMPDEKKLGAYVRAMKDTANIPGVEVYYVDDPVR